MEFLFLYKVRYKDLIALSPGEMGNHLSKSRRFIDHLSDSDIFIQGDVLDHNYALVEGDSHVSKKSIKDSSNEEIISFAKIKVATMKEALEIAQKDPYLDYQGRKIGIHPIIDDK